MQYLHQGCSVHYLDNWSTDTTRAVVEAIQAELHSGCLPNPLNLTLTYEKFPAEPANNFNWGTILDHKTQLASGKPHDWIIHADADEVRESAWGPRVPLRQALYVAQAMGYNCINFGRLLTFHPTPSWECPPNRSCNLDRFEYFTHDTLKGNARQEKAWRNYPANAVDTNEVDISSTGGHILRFLSATITKRVFPWDFVLRHYPIRSQKHGLRKVFQERKPRWNQEERNNPLKEWHAQYDTIRDESHSFLKTPGDEGLNFGSKGDLSLTGTYAQDQPCMQHQ